MSYANPEKQRDYWRERNRSPRGKEAQLRTRYGIGLEEYNKLLQEQGGVCAICGGTEMKRGKYLCVDHDHVTGKIRGLLCDQCNHAIGKFKDDPTLLLKAIDYLTRNQN